jgi:LmbE family N-acetylglucosaminyl deacetylase
MGLHLLGNNESEINHVAYLTNSVPNYAQFDGKTRQKECIAAWDVLRPSVGISFLGHNLNLQDGNLHRSFDEECFGELLALTNSIECDEIVTVALEGGHQDHDITSLVAERIAMLTGLPLILFPTYHAPKNRINRYSVMTSRNASSIDFVLSPARRIELFLATIRIIAKYKTQSRTWVGLAPFIFIRYLMGRVTYEKFLKVESWVQADPNFFLYSNRNKCEIIDYKLFRLKLMSFGINL